MGSLEWATWALVVVTTALVIAACFYAYYTKKMMVGAKEQTEAIIGQTGALKDQTKELERLTRMLLEVSPRDVLLGVKHSLDQLESIVKEMAWRKGG